MLCRLAVLLHRLLSTAHALPAWQGTSFCCGQLEVLVASYQYTSMMFKETNHRLVHPISIPQWNALNDIQADKS